jgi:hypothetical protein
VIRLIRNSTRSPRHDVTTRVLDQGLDLSLIRSGGHQPASARLVPRL